ncbi:phd zinc finger-containing protein-related [Anaeramoeba flamelloides]|uniref:Phd zinc finger-containing protein-related n=1 Tax=Anaeramoeba flamelloides TaxID=1746091 RepID=A0ABQ8YLC3_9EUKA|nr:phd zinc finger-containing protein-related [Anaeramoeba flamelloides]
MSNQELVDRLTKETNLPKSSCENALQLFQNDYNQAKQFLNHHTKTFTFIQQQQQQQQPQQQQQQQQQQPQQQQQQQQPQNHLSFDLIGFNDIQNAFQQVNSDQDQIGKIPNTEINEVNKMNFQSKIEIEDEIQKNENEKHKSGETTTSEDELIKPTVDFEQLEIEKEKNLNPDKEQLLLYREEKRLRRIEMEKKRAAEKPQRYVFHFQNKTVYDQTLIEESAIDKLTQDLKNSYSELSENHYERVFCNINQICKHYQITERNTSKFRLYFLDLITIWSTISVFTKIIAMIKSYLKLENGKKYCLEGGYKWKLVFKDSKPSELLLLKNTKYLNQERDAMQKYSLTKKEKNQLQRILKDENELFNQKSKVLNPKNSQDSDDLENLLENHNIDDFEDDELIVDNQNNLENN